MDVPPPGDDVGLHRARQPVDFLIEALIEEVRRSGRFRGGLGGAGETEKDESQGSGEGPCHWGVSFLETGL
jgi:hypothetical protein